MTQMMTDEHFENARRYGAGMRDGTMAPLEVVAVQGGIFIASLVAEVERLRPYEVELKRIAEDVGEPDDPFAAWESIHHMSNSEGAL